ncbi:hypothetical protein DTO166G4_6691 [Paecilomyces variotii]|nr:hypothetical protein DTO166G4_6691 [Paecilomyces variotii]KAJ9221413.1 hypothetical protein DTO169C6_6240 [Paecilomyces variotii]
MLPQVSMHLLPPMELMTNARTSPVHPNQRRSQETVRKDNNQTQLVTRVMAATDVAVIVGAKHASAMSPGRQKILIVLREPLSLWYCRPTLRVQRRSLLRISRIGFMALAWMTLWM